LRPWSYIELPVLYISSFLVFLAGIGDSFAQTIPDDLAVRNNSFLGLRLGMSVEEAKQAGSKYLIRKPAANFGPYYEAGSLPIEPKGTIRRRLYFNDDYGLYRIVYEMSGEDGGRLKPKAADSLFGALLKKVMSDNPTGKIVKKAMPNVNDLRLEVLQACPDGDPEMRARLNALSIDGVRDVLVQLGAKIGESISPTGMVLAIHCGALPSPMVDIAVSVETRVSLSISAEKLTEQGVTVFMALRNEAITSAMKK